MLAISAMDLPSAGSLGSDESSAKKQQKFLVIRIRSPPLFKSLPPLISQIPRQSTPLLHAKLPLVAPRVPAKHEVDDRDRISIVDCIGFLHALLETIAKVI